MRDRLLLTRRRIAAMAAGVRDVAALPDPVGETLAEWERPNGLRIRKVRVPLGVVGIIYESRPNVTVDTVALALKTGNAIVLRGGKEAAHSNQATGGDPDAVPGVPEGAIRTARFRALANRCRNSSRRADWWTSSSPAADRG